MKYKWALLWFLTLGNRGGQPENVELFVTKAACELAVQKVKVLKEIDFVTPQGQHTKVPVTKNEAYCVPAYPHEE